ncbi:transposase [Streptomyces durmitorensis]|uniref:transposase n=1 Tax=Streptomyces durmitorensis TaxID=319947 RepID=UPI003CD0C248
MRPGRGSCRSTPPSPGPSACGKGPDERGLRHVAGCAGRRRGTGTTRGGLSTKVHLALDGRGRPLSILLTPGQAGDNPQLVPLLEAIRVPRPGPGRPRSRPDRVIADKAYSHPSTRAELRRRRIATTTPERADQKSRRRGRPPCFDRDCDRDLYHDRNVRALLQPAQAMARPGHPIRQARRDLPSRSRHRRHHDLAPLNDRTLPRRPLRQ